MAIPRSTSILTVTALLLLLLWTMAPTALADEAWQPTTTLDSELGVTWRLVQELRALKHLTEAGRQAQAKTRASLLIDFEAIDAVLTMIEQQLVVAIKRKGAGQERH